MLALKVTLFIGAIILAQMRLKIVGEIDSLSYCLLVAMENFSKQEVRLRIGPIGKLARFISTSENFLVYIASLQKVGRS